MSDLDRILIVIPESALRDGSLPIEVISEDDARKKLGASINLEEWDVELIPVPDPSTDVDSEFESVPVIGVDEPDLEAAFTDVVVTEGDSRGSEVERRRRLAGMGLSTPVDWGTQYPFVDLMKLSRRWQAWEEQGDERNRVFQVDEYGWFTPTPGESREPGTIFLVAREYPLPFSERCIVSYQGEGKLNYSSRAQLVSRSTTNDGGVDTIDLATADRPGGNANHLLTVADSDPDDPIRNISIVPESLVTQHEQGRIFNPQFSESCSQFGALRFMDWLGTNNSSLVRWQDRPLVDDRTWTTNGVPLEICIRLCNETGTDMWWNVPHGADDNFVEQAALLIARELDLDLGIYVEYTNEGWNSTFSGSRENRNSPNPVLRGQFNYLRAMGREIFGADGGAPGLRYQGLRTRQIAEIVKPILDGGRCKVVLGVQAWARGLSDAHIIEAEGAFDCLGLTTYFDGGLNGPRRGSPDEAHTASLLGMINGGDEGINRAFDQLISGDQLRHIGRYADYSGVVEHLRWNMDRWRRLLDSNGLSDVELVAYEGGQHLTTNFLQHDRDERFVNFHGALNRHPMMGEIYREVLNTWYAAGGGVHCHYSDFSANPSASGVWGALEYLGQKSSSKQEAIIGIITGK